MAGCETAPPAGAQEPPAPHQRTAVGPTRQGSREGAGGGCPSRSTAWSLDSGPLDLDLDLRGPGSGSGPWIWICYCYWFLIQGWLLLRHLPCPKPEATKRWLLTPMVRLRSQLSVGPLPSPMCCALCALHPVQHPLRARAYPKAGRSKLLLLRYAALCCASSLRLSRGNSSAPRCA
jgi:hypothetical protein